VGVAGAQALAQVGEDFLVVGDQPFPRRRAGGVERGAVEHEPKVHQLGLKRRGEQCVVAAGGRRGRGARRRGDEDEALLQRDRVPHDTRPGGMKKNGLEIEVSGSSLK
jgi:hypothetical protein